MVAGRDEASSGPEAGQVDPEYDPLGKGKVGPDPWPHVDVGCQLLNAFPAQRSHLGLAGFHLSAGEFPLPCQARRVGPLGREHLQGARRPLAGRRPFAGRRPLAGRRPFAGRRPLADDGRPDNGRPDNDTGFRR